MGIVGIIAGEQFSVQMLHDCTHILDEFGVRHKQKTVDSSTPAEEIYNWVDAFERDDNGRILIAGLAAQSGITTELAKRNSTLIIKVPLMDTTAQKREAVETIYDFAPGYPIATVAINNVKNAALLAVSVLSISNDDLRQKLKAFRTRMLEEVQAKNVRLQQGL